MSPDDVFALSSESLAGVCRNKNISQKDYERRDESATDLIGHGPDEKKIYR